MITTGDLPTFNAILNGLSAVFLLTGYRFIKKGNRTAHKSCMISAVVVSALFLASYVFYHYQHGSQPFRGTGLIRPVYFTILITHTVAAMAIVPMVLVTLVRGLKQRFGDHARIARWTFPIWVYVSTTGVVIYLFLYHFFRE